MKNTVKALLTFAASLFLFASCAEEEIQQLGTTVTVTPTELVASDTGSLILGTIDVKADGIWIATSSNDDWFTFAPASGEGFGKITVSLKPNTDEYDEVSGPREGSISIICGESIVVVTVKQAGEPGLDASRTYAKITKVEDIEAGKGYLIVANTGASLVAGKPFNATSETYYSYIYGDDVTEKDGIITRPNANNGYTFVAKGDGFAIQQSNGRYLFQAAAYNNFYSTTELDKADVWKVAFNEDGTAKIENQTVAGKYFQFSIGYSSYGAYGSAQDGAALPMLYKDSAAPSDEVISVAEETMVKGTATSATIAVSSNKTWKVRCHDNWIKTFTKEGSGNGTIAITFDANESYEEVREAKFQIIGETTNFWVTLKQDHLYAVIDATVAEFKEKEVGDQLYRLTGKIKGIVNSTYGNIYLQDGTGYVYVYTLFENADKVAKSFKNLGVREGDIVTVVGPRDQYANASVEDQKIQMKNAYCEKAVKSQDATVEQLIAAPVASTYLEGQYYRVQGLVKSVVSDTYGNFYLQSTDSEQYIYVYGLTAAPVAKNDKSYKDLGIAVGDLVTLVGQRGQYAKASVEDQKEQVANAYYITHETPAPPAPTLDICEQIFVDAGYKMEDYTRQEITWTHNGYYNSTDASKHSTIQTTASNSTQFAATQQFHRSALPVGTVLVIQGSTSEWADGWMYRPEGWQSKGSKNTGSRPNNVTGKSSPVVEVNDAWWGTSFNYRAFNVARVGNPALTEAQQEELEHVFGMFIPKPLASTDAMLTAKGYNPANYNKLTFTYTKDAFYNSTSTTNSSLVTTGSNVIQFVATNIVEKSQIPNGSLIVVNYGVQYRPEGWQTLGEKNTASRPANVGNTITVVDDAWWGNFNYRAFNLARFGNPNMNSDAEKDAVIANFAVYVPKN